jgi:glycosyltransferase involved in cell wall biosynthesis
LAPQAVTVSFRLGGDDGVSVEASKWANALRELGFETRRVAGKIEGSAQPDDVTIPELAIDATEPVREVALVAAFEGADLLVVDNICSLPLNPAAAQAVANVAAQQAGRVCFRHHDLPWQRRVLQHLETAFPPRVAHALHATINLRSRRELEARGYANTTTIHNYFDLDAPPGDRAKTRKHFDFSADDFVVFQPARAIERKNIAGGLRFALQLARALPEGQIKYWLSGPAEDGYEPTLERLLAHAPLPVTLGRAPTAADAYAACDLVAFPSTWEGFGNPVLESIAHNRACAAFPYPVLAEITAAGVRVFSTERVEPVVRFLAEPAETRDRYFEVNRHRARISFSLADLPSAIDAAFAAHGWISW